MRLSEREKELADYQAETIKVIRGESNLNSDLLNELVGKAKAEIAELQAVVKDAKTELDERMNSVSEEQQEFDKLTTWADLYDNCTFAAKKMIVSQFIKAVHVYRDYTLKVVFNVSFDEFKSFADGDKNSDSLESSEIRAAV